MTWPTSATTDPPPLWHALPPADVLTRVGSTADGLDVDVAQRRLLEWGPNALAQTAQPGFLAALLGQFSSFIVWLLVGAAAVSGVLGEWIDALVIGCIVVLNAVLGAWQEFSAERSLAALKRLTAPLARVRRGAETCVVPSSQLVPGDVLLLDSGDVVAADARLLESATLACDEKSLTGESEPTAKRATAVVDPAATLADRATMVYLGTTVATGTARAVVVATGMRSEVGLIAGLLESAGEGEDTPLQARLVRLGRVLVMTSLAIVGGIFALGLARGEPLLGLFLLAVSLAVAAVPEGLPAIVTIALAVGVRRMVRRKALIRRLPAVETLGSTNVICTDKTGTLTVGQMTVRAAVVAGARYDVTGEGYAPTGEVTRNGRRAEPDVGSALALLARNLVGATNADVVVRDGVHVAAGDPTEAAMLVLAHKLGLTRPGFDAEAPKVGEVPFDSDRKRASVARRLPGGGVEILVNGAPEGMLALCTHRLADGGRVAMTDLDRAALQQENAALAAGALRVLACARRELSDAMTEPMTAQAWERELTWVGLVGMYDPPRSEAKAAVDRCRVAGIRVVMITGDQPRTAFAIARELGIARDEAAVTSGAELSRMDESALAVRVTEAAVFARVTAADKLRIVRAWQVHGAVVAMTGDGVNDAPALRGADVGVAMGLAGTEVAKQAADMVVTDDNFASIVAAVEEGRGVYDNIQKALLFLLGGNSAELMVLTVCQVAGLPSPLLPIQILWINLVTDGLPALFLGSDPVAPDVMQRAPRPRAADIIDRDLLGTMIWTATLTSLVAIGAYAYGLVAHDEGTARTHCFAALVFAQLTCAFGCRSKTIPVWRMALRTNGMLAVVVAVSCVLQIWSHHDATLARLLGTSTIGWSECASVFLLACVPAAVLETRKWLRFGRSIVRETA